MKNKNKIGIKQVKALQKNFLQHFFLFFFCWLFIFVLLLFGQILKYRENKSAKGSYNIAMPYVTSGVLTRFSFDLAWWPSF